MSDSPYDPPEAPLQDQNSGELEGSGTFEIAACMREAWEDTWRNFPLWLGVGLVALVVAVLSFATLIGVILVWPVLAWGVVVFFLNMTDQRSSFGDLFSGFSSYGVALVNMGVLIIAYMLLSAIGGSVSAVGEQIDSAALVTLGFLFNMFWSFGVVVRLNFAPMFLVDREMGAIESLQTSWESTRGQTFKLIGLVVAGFVVTVVGLAAFVIGLIPASVMVYLMWTSAYRQMVGRSTRAGMGMPPTSSAGSR